LEKYEIRKYFTSRIKKVRDRLLQEDADCIIIFKDENIYYLTGFYAKNSGSMLIVSGKNIYLLVHFIYYEQAKKSSVLKNIRIIKFVSDRDDIYKEVIISECGKTAGIEGNSINYDVYVKNKKILSGLGWKVKNLPGIIDEQRMIKDGYEISSIKKACRITDNVMKDIFGMDSRLISGFNENEFALYIETMMVKRNSAGGSFDLIVASGASSSLPHYMPSNRRIKSGWLLFDIGCIYENYCSDITRTVFIKSSQARSFKSGNTGKLKKIYDIVLQAQLRALDRCREGILCRELDKVARDYISEMGYGENFGHGLGHGVGLEVHEGPRVSADTDIMIKENMVITIEPGIYIENIGGVRIEDMVLVRKKGCENLYSSPKALTVID